MYLETTENVLTLHLPHSIPAVAKQGLMRLYRCTAPRHAAVQSTKQGPHLHRPQSTPDSGQPRLSSPEGLRAPGKPPVKAGRETVPPLTSALYPIKLRINGETMDQP